MRKHIALLPVVLLAGCTTLGAGKLSDRVSPGEVVQQIQCELAAASQETAGALSSWVAGVDLTLKLTDSLTQSPSSLTLAPQLTGAAMSIPLGASAENKRIGARTIRYDVALSDLSSGTPAADALLSVCAKAKKSDGLGLQAWISQAASVAVRNGAQLTALIYDVQFTATRGGSGGLTFKTTPIALIDLKIDGPKASNQRDNRLIVTFKKDTSRADEAGGLTPIPEELRQQLQDSLDDIANPESEGATIQLAPGQTIIIQ